MDDSKKKTLTKQLRKAKKPEQIAHAVNAWFDAGGHPVDRYVEGETVYWQALSSGDKPTVARALEMFRPWTIDYGWRAMRDAVCAGEFTIVTKLMEEGVSLSSDGISDPASISHLAAAVSDGNLHTAAILIKNGASIDERGTLGFNALHWAAAGGLIKSVELLLKHGADPMALTQEDEGDDALAKNAIQIAEAHGYNEIVVLLKSSMDESVPEKVETEQLDKPSTTALKKRLEEKHGKQPRNGTSSGEVNFSWPRALFAVFVVGLIMTIKQQGFDARNAITGFEPSIDGSFLTIGVSIVAGLVFGFMGGKSEE